ncbi:MAG: cysteine desulfurase family protein [Candidatus Paceibacterota bacterium]
MIYLDNQASTTIHPEVLKLVTQVMQDNFANPHSQHIMGQKAMHIVDNSRRIIAEYFGIEFSETLFTSGATESNNIAIQGVILEALKTREKIEIITTPIEHSAVIAPITDLVHQYPNRIIHKVTKINESGLVKLEDIQDLLTTDTVLVSIIHANNEIGTIQPIRDIGRMLKKYNPDSIYPLFHSDGAQAVWSEKINLKYSNLDLYSFSGHKMYAPKGIGALYINKNTPIQPIVYGGGQEYGMRSGTLNTAGIAGLGEAIRLLSISEHKNIVAQVKDLRDILLDKVLSLKGVSLNGDRDNRLPQNINISIANQAAEKLVIAADLAGLSISAGSACHSGAMQESSVIKAISPSQPEKAKTSIRISLSQYTTEDEIQQTYKIINSII